MKRIFLVILSFLICTSICLAESKEKVRVQVQFSEDTEVGKYNDALYFTQEEYEQLTQKQIDAIKKQRVDNWVNIIKTPVIQKEQTKEELQIQEQQLINQKASIESQLSEVSSKISAIQVKEEIIKETK
jgi:hypothetical protein